jgi:hypothetical protein
MVLSLDYIAGYIDADGTIVVVKNAEKHRYYGKVQIYSQNMAVLESMKAGIGGKISPSGRIFSLQISPKEAVKLLKAVAPLLQVKREQALLVLELHRHIDEHQKNRKSTGKPGGRVHDASVWEYREQLAQRVSDLNWRDSRAFETNRVNSVKTQEWATPSQAAEGEVGSAEGVTTRGPSPNGNDPQECPARKGRDSLANTILM